MTISEMTNEQLVKVARGWNDIEKTTAVVIAIIILTMGCLFA